MKKLLISLFATLSTGLFAQTLNPTVITTAGGYTTGATVSLSWTLGELATETLSNSNLVLTQGFQQPDSVSLPALLGSFWISFFTC